MPKAREIALVVIIALGCLIMLPLLTATVGSTSPNQLPIASFTYTPDIPTPGEAISFDASSSYDLDGWITQYTWNFGDGNITTVTNGLVTHSYPVDGRYTVELTVADNGGSTSVAVAVIEVSCLTFFRVCYYGTLVPMSNVKVTVYYYDGYAWVAAPAGSSGVEIRYDNMTQPYLASTWQQKYRNPGFTASILRRNSSNIGFEIHRSSWIVFFKFEWASYVAYWPNDTTRVYNYNHGAIMSHDYGPTHQAYMDPSAGTYVIRAANIQEDGVYPTETHPIIVGVLCPPTPPKYYLTVRTDPSGITTVPGEGWYNNGTNVVLTAPTYVNVSSTMRYRFSYWDVNGTSRGSGVNPITVCMTANYTATAHYVTQYAVTFNCTGISSDGTGTIVTINGTAKTFTELPYTLWVDNCSTVTYSYNPTVPSSVSGKQYRLNSVSGPSSPFAVSGPLTITGTYMTQYLITFTQAGFDPTAIGTIVNVNGSGRTFAEIPHWFWADSGSSVNYSYTSIISSSVSGKQFRLNGVGGPSSPFTVTGPMTVTGTYVTQFLVTFAHSGLNSNATGTVVTVNGSGKTLGNLPYSLWADNGSTVIYSYSSPVASTNPNEQFRLNTVSGPTSPITVTGATTVTGDYMIQYLVTFTQSGLDSSATSIVVTVNGNPKTLANLPYSFWADNGNSTSYSFNTTVASSVTGKRFKLDSVGGPTSPISVTQSATVTGNYVTQYQVTFAQTGLDSTAVSSVVWIDGSAKAFTDLPYNEWFDSGSLVTYSCNDTVLSNETGKRFKLSSTSGPTSPITVTDTSTVTCNYGTQYELTFGQTGVGTDFAGTVVTVDSSGYSVSGLPAVFWWNQGSSHNFTFASPLVVNAGNQYTWSSTSGITNLQSGTLTVSTSGNVIGNYVMQNCITFDVVGANPDYAGAVVFVDGIPYNISNMPKTFYWPLWSVHNFSFQSPLIVTSDVKKYVWTSTTGLSTLQSGSITIANYGSIVGNYKTQYYLDLSTNPVGINAPSGTGWYDAGTYAAISTEEYVYGGSRYRFSSWTTSDMSEITNSTSPSTTVLMDKGKTLTANYVHQFLVTFTQTGLSTDADGTIVTVNSSSKTYSSLPYSEWFDEGTTINYQYETTVTSTTSGKRYNLQSISGPSSPMTVTADTNVTGNYGTQYYLTVSSPYGTTGGQGWYDSDATAYATLNTSSIDQGNGTCRVFINWNGDASGTNYAQSNPITMNGPKTALANWKTQYNVTFTHLNLDLSASSTVVTVNTNPVGYSQLPYNIWVDNGSSVTYYYNNVTSSTPGKRFILIGVTGLPSPMTVTSPTTITGNFKIQYQITFNQTGISADFTGTIVAIDGTDYSYGTLAASFWWDEDSSHTFSYLSPLVVNASRQYAWTSTTGLTSLQNGTLTITGPGNVLGNYAIQIKQQITFSQIGIDPDYTGTVVTIDGTNYNTTQLSASFWWDTGSNHTFAYQSPLLTAPNDKQYIWTSTAGLSPSQNGSLVVTTSGTITGNYKTQYFLTLETSPPGVASLTGEGWYDVGTNATVTAPAFIDIVVGSSRYRFNGWTTANMSEIADPARSPTTVLMDEAKTVTANYVTQYKVTFNQSGVGSGYTGTVVTIDLVAYNRTDLQASFWWDKDSVHIFAFQSPLETAVNSTQYVWTSTSGLSTLQGGSITVSASGNVTGNYKTQYYLTVTSPHDSPIPTSGYFDAGESVAAFVTSPCYGPVNGTRHVCTGWTGSGSVPPSGTAANVTFTMNQPSSITWNWKTQYLLGVLTDPSFLAPKPTIAPPGENYVIEGYYWYDPSTNVILTAQPVAGYSFSYWDKDGTSQGNGVNPITVNMNSPHTAIAHYAPLPSTLTVSISPPSATIYVGQSITLSSSVSGGTQPYGYQWYLNGNPVSGATSSTWTFSSVTPGVYYVTLRVTDTNNITAESGPSRIMVMRPPVGGYAISKSDGTPMLSVLAYATLMVLFAAVLSLKKRKRK